MFQFLEGRQQIRYGPAPAVQSPDQDHIDLAAASGLQQFLTSLSLRRTGADLTDLHSDGPAPPADILPQGVNLQRNGLLVVGGHAGVEAGAKHFRRLPCLAKNAIRSGFLRGPFYGHFERSIPPGRSRSFSAMQIHHITQRQAVPAAPMSRGTSTANIPMG